MVQRISKLRCDLWVTVQKAAVNVINCFLTVTYIVVWGCRYDVKKLTEKCVRVKSILLLKHSALRKNIQLNTSLV